MHDPFKVVRDFERAIAEYTGAPYVVSTTSCTAALMLAVEYHIRKAHGGQSFYEWWNADWRNGEKEGSYPQTYVEIPKRTYKGVADSIIHAGGRPTFRDEKWEGAYRLKPLHVWDSARLFSRGMYGPLPKDELGLMLCVSFHWSKTLGIQQGGAILHDDPEADKWLRMARFDGRQEGVHPKDQKEWIIGHHCYMSPETAAAGLVRLAHLPRHNEPLPWGPGTDSDYPELDKMEIFK